jgi:hypothetical protein
MVADCVGWHSPEVTKVVPHPTYRASSLYIAETIDLQCHLVSK